MMGCAAQVQHNTPSQKAERTFNAPPERVQAALLTEMVNRQYTISKQTANVIEGTKPAAGFAANVLLGTTYDPTVDVRATFTVIPIGNQTRVVGDLALVSNGGSAFEKVTPINNSESSMEMQAALNRLTP
jgi:hypothetical protein